MFGVCNNILPFGNYNFTGGYTAPIANDDIFARRPITPGIDTSSEAFSRGASDAGKLYFLNSSKCWASKLQGLETQIQNSMKDEKLTAEHKKALQKVLDVIQSLKAYIASLSQGNTTVEATDDVNKKVEQIEQLASAAYQKIAGEISAKEGTDSTDTTTDSSSTNDTKDEDGVKIGDILVDPKTGRPKDIQETTASEVENICSDIYTAVNGPGTDIDVIQTAFEGGKIHAGNIIEVIAQWEKAYGKHTSTGNDGFFARIFDDLSDSEQKKYIPFMRDALIKRAEALGIYDKISEYVGKVNKGMARHNAIGMLWMDDHQIANDLMKIYDEIVKKEKSNVTEAKKQTSKDDKKVEDTKAKEKEKFEEEIEQNKAEFLRDMKRDLRLEKTPVMSDNVKVIKNDDGSFKCFEAKIEGVKYEANSYSELKAKIQKEGYEPEDWLVRKINKAA